MFTGIIQAVGRVESSTPTAAGRRFVFDTGAMAGRSFRLGDSIAVNGACLTVVAQGPATFSADVSPETLRVTTLGALGTGSPVNLEPALTLNEPLGGHLVTGHVDGIASVADIRTEGEVTVMRFRLPSGLSRYVAHKGSICLDGVSLTVNAVDDGCAQVTLIPHTLKQTIMQNYRIGTPVNVEIDLVARYVERLLGTQ